MLVNDLVNCCKSLLQELTNDLFVCFVFNWINFLKLKTRKFNIRLSLAFPLFFSQFLVSLFRSTGWIRQWLRYHKLFTFYCYKVNKKVYKIFILKKLLPNLLIELIARVTDVWIVLFIKLQERFSWSTFNLCSL